MEQDPKLLSTIVQNLLSNAIKYTPEKGKVIITASGTTRHLQIEVSDTGLGIPDDQQEHVFEKLFRASNVRKKDTVGTGLGLYVVKTIVDSLGGTIRFTSEEGLGTTFMVRLPRRVKSQTKKSSLT